MQYVVQPGGAGVDLVDRERFGDVGGDVGDCLLARWGEVHGAVVVDVVDAVAFAHSLVECNRFVGCDAFANPDDWAVAIASGAGVGVTSAATISMHPHAGLVYVPLTDAPQLPVRLAWPDPATHPAATEFAALAQTFGGS